MKNIFFTFLILFIILSASAQKNNEDVLYIKIDSIKSQVEQIPNKIIEVRIEDDNLFVSNVNQIEKFSNKEILNYKKEIISIIDTALTFSKCLGLKMGFNLSNITVEKDNIDATYKPKFQISLAYLQKLNKKIFIQSELQYSSIGVEYLTKITTDDYSSIEITNKYLNVNSMFMYKAFGEKIEFFLLGGPYLAYLVSGNYVSSYSSGGDWYSTNYKYSDFSSLNRFDIGLSIGFGLKYDIKSIGRFYIDNRLSTGIIGYNKQSIFSNRNQVYSMSIGYFLPLN
jgi:hypothetical protein